MQIYSKMKVKLIISRIEKGYPSLNWRADGLTNQGKITIYMIKFIIEFSLTKEVSRVINER